MTAEEFEPIPGEVEWVGRRVIGSAIQVHRALGPGYKESIYVEALCIELNIRGLKFEREKPITVIYEGAKSPASDWICSSRAFSLSSAKSRTPFRQFTRGK